MTWSDERVSHLLAELERIAGGDLDRRIALSQRHDEIDAVAHAINVLVGELQIVAEELRRAKEEAEAASVAKTAFLRNVSHELRTPLTVILGMSDLIASGRLPRQRVEELRARINANGRALRGILDDLLDMAKVEAERFEVDPRPVVIADIAAEVVATFETEAAWKKLALRLDCDAVAGVRAIADARRVRQVLINLIANAIKFTERGHVSVRASRSSDGAALFVDISDTGIGMTRAQATQLFEPFVQADGTIARRFGGSGLGLAISKQFTEAMGGTLEVIACEPGSGTTFRLALPVAPDVAPVTTAAQSAPATRGDLRDWRILVAEDNDDVRALIVEQLRGAGAVAIEAADGLQAIDAVERASFDAIVMDVRMPRLDGIETTRRLRASGVTSPIIALTADAVAEQRRECLDAGCSGYMPKPFDIAQLVALLSKPDH